MFVFLFLSFFPLVFLLSCEDKLEQYIQRGKYLAKNPSESLRNLEDLIGNYDKSEVYKTLLESKEYMDFGKKNEFFIALALPSLTGKTQTAFAIRSKRPLYFAFSKDQEVNGCFFSMSWNFQILLNADRETAIECLENELKKLVGYQYKSTKIDFLKDVLNSKPTVITLQLIDLYLRNVKFKSLGFLAAIIKNSEKLYKKENNDEWMRFFADNQANYKHLKYKPLSLSDLECDKRLHKAFVEKYFVFMDEFEIDGGLVMFRNICRLINVPCLVASTNPRFVDLVGVSLESSSRQDPSAVWCVAFPKLSNLSGEEVTKFFNEEINFERFIELAKKVSIREEERMRQLLEFLKDQAIKSRPGISLFLFNALRDLYQSFEDLKYLTVDKFFKDFLNLMIYYITYRKTNAFRSLEGGKSNIDMLSGTSFNSKYSISKDPRTDTSYLIDKHFFYLKNTLINSKDNDPFLLFKQSWDNSIEISTLPNVRSRYSFQCYFDENEELLKLICLLARFKNTPYNVGSNSFKETS